MQSAQTQRLHHVANSTVNTVPVWFLPAILPAPPPCPSPQTESLLPAHPRQNTALPEAHLHHYLFILPRIFLPCPLPLISAACPLATHNQHCFHCTHFSFTFTTASSYSPAIHACCRLSYPKQPVSQPALYSLLIHLHRGLHVLQAHGGLRDAAHLHPLHAQGHAPFQARGCRARNNKGGRNSEQSRACHWFHSSGYGQTAVSFVL